MRLLGDLRVISSFLNSFSILRAAQGAKYHYIPLWCVLMRAIHCYTYYASHPMNFSHQAGLQQTMFIPRESVSTSPSKTGSPGKAKPISSCQGIHCCINWYQQISTARNCPIISIKNHQELLNLRVVWCVWSFHVTRPSHFNIYKYILTLSYLEARVYCSTLYQSPGKRSLAMEMAVPAASPVIMTWADTISNPGWPACPGNTVTNPSGSYYGFAIPLSPSVQVSCKCLAVLWYVLATHTWYVSGIDCQQGSTRYLYAT